MGILSWKHTVTKMAFVHGFNRIVIIEESDQIKRLIHSNEQVCGTEKKKWESELPQSCRIYKTIIKHAH